MKRVFSWFAATPLLLLSALALTLCCCTTNWLPDSSGFVTVSQRGKVVLFDIASGKETTLAPGLTMPRFASVAVSPDSKRIAVAQMVPGDGHNDLLLSIYSVTGELQHQSEKIEVPAKQAPYQVLAVVNYWSPDGKRLLLCPFGNASLAMSYDLETQQVQKFEDAMPLGMLGFESLPIRAAVPFLPNSKGFLGFKMTSLTGPQPGTTPEIRLFQFAPAVPAISEAFTYTPAAREQVQPAANESAANERVFLPARWSQGQMLMTRQRGYLVVDPEKQQVDYRVDEKIEKLAEYARQHDVRVAEVLGDELVVQLNETVGLVEIAELKTGNVRSKVELPKQQWFPITIAASPNGQFLLVSCSVPHPRYWVFDSEGKQIHQGSFDEAGGSK